MTGAMDLLDIDFRHNQIVSPLSEVSFTVNATSIFDLVLSLDHFNVACPYKLKIVTTFETALQSILTLRGPFSYLQRCLPLIKYSLPQGSTYVGPTSISVQGDDLGNNQSGLREVTTMAIVNIEVTYECGGTVVMTSPGVVRDRLFPEKDINGTYRSNQRCRWLLLNTTMVMSTKFDLEEEGDVVQKWIK
jgi:hypothetical protein